MNQAYNSSDRGASWNYADSHIKPSLNWKINNSAFNANLGERDLLKKHITIEMDEKNEKGKVLNRLLSKAN